MHREDYDLAFMLQYENIAWYENGKVRILDRRIYPTEVKFVECSTYTEVAQAITDMVTQSAGPYTAAGMGMALAAYEAKDLNNDEKIKFLTQAAYTISHARVTTVNRMTKITNNCLDAAKKAIENNQDVVDAIFNETIASLNRRYHTMSIIAKNLIDLIPNNSTIMTQCFGETIVGTMFREAKKQNKKLRVFTPETRPYFQGARLTATVAHQQGFDTTVITDNMASFVMKNEKVDFFLSAADVICMDGHIVNKIGTYQLAILAKYHQIPYFVTGIPDLENPDDTSVKIEFRDPQLVKEARGIQNTLNEVKGYYPSFDITPPHLVSAVITDKAVYSPYSLNKYYEGEVKQYY